MLNGPLAHQIARVLRLAPGARLVLLDGEGQQAEAELVQVSGRAVRVRLLVKGDAPGEPRWHITLYQALLKGPRWAWALQKGTELGVAAFVPIISERCVVRPTDVAQKQTRWQNIVREAAEQAGRGRLPTVRLPLSFADACQQASRQGTTLLAWEGAHGDAASLRQALADAPGKALSLFIGPEGGFTPQEAALARSWGIRWVSLGPRTLRAETAAIAAVAAVLFALGEWDIHHNT